MTEATNRSALYRLILVVQLRHQSVLDAEAFAAAARPLAAPWLAGALFGLGGGCGWLLNWCYDSGWVEVARGSRSVPFDHGLGRAPGRLQVLFSPTQNGEIGYPIEFRWSDTIPGNPVAATLDAAQVRLELWDGAPLRATYDAATGRWTSHDRGRIRVRALH